MAVTTLAAASVNSNLQCITFKIIYNIRNARPKSSSLVLHLLFDKQLFFSSATSENNVSMLHQFQQNDTVFLLFIAILKEKQKIVPRLNLLDTVQAYKFSSGGIHRTTTTVDKTTMEKNT